PSFLDFSGAAVAFAALGAFSGFGALAAAAFGTIVKRSPAALTSCVPASCWFFMARSAALRAEYELADFMLLSFVWVGFGASSVFMPAAPFAGGRIAAA